MKILFTGGGTAGHLMPLLAVGRELRRLYAKDDLKLYYIGPNDRLGLVVLRQENFIIHTIITGKIRRYFSLLNILDILFNIPISFIQSFFLLLFLRPNLVFSKGGTGALPVTFFARVLWIPVFIHESDVVPGLSNRVASGWAKKIFISFEKTEYFNLSKTILVGNPIRKELLEGSESLAKDVFNLTLEKPVILFLGGSQGSEIINDFVLLMLNDILQYYEVIHASGLKNYKRVQLEAKQFVNSTLEKYYHLRGSLDEVELKHAYKVSQLIISRAGGGGIFEIAAVGKPSILVPLPRAAGDHQSKNAYQYAHAGATLIIEHENLTPNFFLGKINALFSNPEMMEKMKVSALNFAKPLASKAIAREILEYLSKP